MSTLSDVYWNSRKRCFSIKPRRPQGPVYHRRGFFVVDQPVFKVSEKGRQWVIANRRKTVHATIRGYPRVPELFPLPRDARRVRYNPYRDETFRDDHGPVFQAETAFLINNEVWIV